VNTISHNCNNILGIEVKGLNYEIATKKILDWTKLHEPRYVCLANVHTVMEAVDDQKYQDIINQADLVIPDGMPLVWMLRLMGHRLEDRVYGPTLTLWVLGAAARQNVPVGFFGGAPDVLEALVHKMGQRFPGLKIAYRHSPPFREFTREEDEQVARDINASGARILFVGLGCPKQERWMAAQRGKVRAVMLGVGAAFDFHAGTLRQAPRWMQDRGLEWLFRLYVEPRRLWGRYFKHNPRFVLYSVLQLLRLKSFGRPVQ
jgi:N-acetylglucosaminyldiphosphoundecaprenol N-acetyl-beta-D-mannosaminyltransferase